MIETAIAVPNYDKAILFLKSCDGLMMIVETQLNIRLLTSDELLMRFYFFSKTAVSRL
jgi:hypothetical protein